MPSWYQLPQIEYYAGRYFTHNGEQYTPGQKVPRELVNKWNSIEAAVRGRWLIPIAADYHDIPRHVYPEAKHYEEMLRRHRERANRLNLPVLEEAGEPVTEVPQRVAGSRPVEDTPDIEEVGFDPNEYTIPEVIQYVEENPEETEQVLEAERRGKGRVTLITELEDRLTAPD